MNMSKYTAEQMAKIKALADNASVITARKPILFYRKNDKAFALFRVQAANHIHSLIISAALGQKPLKSQREFAAKWINDGNPMFREFYAALNDAAGYVVINLD